MRILRKQITPWSAPVAVTVTSGAASIDLAAKDNIKADTFAMTLDSGANTLTLSNLQAGRRILLRLTVDAGGSTLQITNGTENATVTPKIETEIGGTAVTSIPLDSGKTNHMSLFIVSSTVFVVDAYS